MAVSYILKRSRKRRKTISLQITEQADVVVQAPYFTPVAEINSFLEQKSSWIQKNLRRTEEQKHQSREKLYESGESFYFLGATYPLEVFFRQDLPAGLVFSNSRFYLNCQDGPPVRKNYFIQWYKNRAAEYLASQVKSIGRRLQLLPANIRITSARTRWGSCSPDNKLAFSFRLIMAPPIVVDYVIIHELMHIKEKNHSARFWNLLEAAMPGYGIHRRWLRENGHKFVL